MTTPIKDGAGTTQNINTVAATAGLMSVVAIGDPTSGTGISVGQQTMANSWPVALASNQAAIPVTPSAPAGASGTSAYKNTALSNTGVNIKSSAGVVTAWHFYNPNTSAVFVHFYNKATAPTTGTDTPIRTIGLPASGGATVAFPFPLGFGTGIGISCTANVGDADNTAPTTGIAVDVEYV